MEIPIIKENYPMIWDSIVPKPGSYKFGEKRLHQFIEFITQVKFTLEDWNYWMDRLNSTDKLERRFLQSLLKYKRLTTRVIMMNSITASIQEQGEIYNDKN